MRHLPRKRGVRCQGPPSAHDRRWLCFGTVVRAPGCLDPGPTSGVDHDLARKPVSGSRPQSRLGRLAAHRILGSEFAAAGALTASATGAIRRQQCGGTMLSVRNAQASGGPTRQVRGRHEARPDRFPAGSRRPATEFAQALAVLRSDAAPMPKTQLRVSWGASSARLGVALCHFDFEPIARASSGRCTRSRARRPRPRRDPVPRRRAIDRKRRDNVRRCSAC